MMGDAKDFARNNSLIYSNLKNEILDLKPFYPNPWW